MEKEIVALSTEAVNVEYYKKGPIRENNANSVTTLRTRHSKTPTERFYTSRNQ